jgi:hypothetical protein
MRRTASAMRQPFSSSLGNRASISSRLLSSPRATAAMA